MTAAASRHPIGLSEDEVQRAVVQHLEARSRTGVWWCAIPNGGSRHPVEAAKLKGLGVVAGAPDLLVVVQGRAHGLEIKTETGRLSVEQRVQHRRLEVAGAAVAVVHGLDEAVKQLVAWGAIR